MLTMKIRRASSVFGDNISSVEELKAFLKKKKKFQPPPSKREAIQRFKEETELACEVGRSPGYKATEAFLKHVPDPFRR